MNRLWFYATLIGTIVSSNLVHAAYISESDFFAKYPFSITHDLGSTSVKLPIRASQARGLVLGGVANLAQLEALVSPTGSHAYAVSNTEGAVFLFATSHAQIDFGNEVENADGQTTVFLLVLTSDDLPPVDEVLPDKLTGLDPYLSILPLLDTAFRGDIPNGGFRVLKMGASAGKLKQVFSGFGYDSVPNITTEFFDESSQVGFRLYENGKLAVSVTKSRRALSFLSLPFAVGMRFFSGPNSMNEYASGKRTVGTFAKGSDVFSYAAPSEFGGLLQTIGFQPSVWQVFDQFSYGVTFSEDPVYSLSLKKPQSGAG